MNTDNKELHMTFTFGLSDIINHAKPTAVKIWNWDELKEEVVWYTIYVRFLAINNMTICTTSDKRSCGDFAFIGATRLHPGERNIPSKGRKVAFERAITPYDKSVKRQLWAWFLDIS